jgi:hypothetical protein
VEKPKSPRYDASVGHATVERSVRCECGKIPEGLLKNRNPARAITTLRPERGNLELNYDGSAGQILKSLRPQFGQKYAAKKVRNSKAEFNSTFLSTQH